MKAGLGMSYIVAHKDLQGFSQTSRSCLALAREIFNTLAGQRQAFQYLAIFTKKLSHLASSLQAEQGTQWCFVSDMKGLQHVDMKNGRGTPDAAPQLQARLPPACRVLFLRSSRGSHQHSLVRA